MADFLFRGVSASLHEQLCGELRPKNFLPFAREPSWDSASWDDSAWGESEINGVVEHQLDQAGLPTSGISTTPHIHRAHFYATHGGKFATGYIYVIDRGKLDALRVRAFAVNELLNHPSVPEDDEVILVAEDQGVLPPDIVVEVRKVAT